MHATGQAGAEEAPHEGSEARQSERFALFLRAAKLVADEREFLCILRDASASGVRIRLFHGLPQFRVLELDLGCGNRLPVDIVWQDADHAGLRFHRETDVQRFLDDGDAAFPRRQLRLRLSLPALAHSGGTGTPVTIRDISQQGACIESEKHLLLKELIRIDAEGLRSIYAKVRWRRAPLYGLVFEHPFRLDELARAAAPLQIEREATVPPG